MRAQEYLRPSSQYRRKPTRVSCSTKQYRVLKVSRLKLALMCSNQPSALHKSADKKNWRQLKCNSDNIIHIQSPK